MPSPQRPVAAALPPLHRYHHMHLVLRKRILEGHYPRDSLLSSERDLAQEFGAARVTVRSALAALERDGLVRREQGRGTIVALPAIGPAEGPRAEERDAFDLLFESLMRMGLRTQVKVLAYQRAEAPASVLTALGVDRGTAMCRIDRLRLLDRTPIAFSVVWLPAALCKGLTRRELAARPLLAWLQHQGLIVDRADETLCACNADIDVASALAVPVGSALFWVRRTLYDRAGMPVLYFDGQFRPERYQYRLQLARDPRAARISVVTDAP